MREEQVVCQRGLRLLFREMVEALDGQELEKDLRMPCRPSAGSHNRLRWLFLARRDEEIPVHHRVEPVVDFAAPAVCVISTRKGRRPYFRFVILQLHSPVALCYLAHRKNAPHRFTGWVGAVKFTAKPTKAVFCIVLTRYQETAAIARASRNTPKTPVPTRYRLPLHGMVRQLPETN